METYYQESGRAGRDGLPSECLLFFRPADVHRQSAMVFYENAGLQNLYDIVRYCLTKKQCRRSAIFQHFAEPGRDCNGMCDNCAFSCEVTEMDLSGHAKLVVSVVRNMQENEQRATMLQLVDKIKNKQKELGSEQKRATLEQLVLQLILDRVLKEEFQHTAYATNAYVTLGPLAKQVLQGKKTIRLEVASQQNMDSCRKKTKRGLASSLEYKLDKLRKELCLIDGGVFPHSILSTQQISLISSIKPKTWEELEKIIGKLKTEKYGNRILEEVKRDANLEQATNEMLDEEEKVNKHRKKMKTKNDVVLVESSDDDA